MDINDYLKQLTTASADNGATSAAWLRGKKRKTGRENDGNGGGADGNSPSKAARAEADGLDMTQLKEELAKERSDASRVVLKKEAQATEVTEQEAARRAHLILEYVMTRLLGGRHNAARGAPLTCDTAGDGLSDTVPCLARIAAERAHLVLAAAFNIQHVVHAGRGADTAAYSVVHRERAADGIIGYHKSLRACDLQRDVAGGVTAGMAPHVRSHAIAVVEAGLRGEAWTRQPGIDGENIDGTASTPRSSAAAPLPPIVLFGTESADKGAFSLDNFLNADSSDAEGE